MGAGTTVTIYLPRSARNRPQPQASSPCRTAPAWRAASLMKFNFIEAAYWKFSFTDCALQNFVPPACGHALRRWRQHGRVKSRFSSIAAMKVLFNVLGCLAVLLAILGVFLPLLPTTPFLLLASACFARGSDRLHSWLLNHGVFGQYLRNFEAGRGIPRKAKIVASTLLWASLSWSMMRFDSIALRLALAATGIAVTIYLWKFLPTLQLRHAAHAAPLGHGRSLPRFGYGRGRQPKDPGQAPAGAVNQHTGEKDIG
jgi:uncharacterized membrane protein YbaN (DUF454 family)